MNVRELAQEIKNVAKEITGAEPDENESLKESGIDSLSLVAVVAGIEEKFCFSFSEDDLQPDELKTLGDLVRITAKYL